MKYASFVRLGETCFGVFHKGKIFYLGIFVKKLEEYKNYHNE